LTDRNSAVYHNKNADELPHCGKLHKKSAASLTVFSALTLLFGRQVGHPTTKKNFR